MNVIMLEIPRQAMSRFVKGEFYIVVCLQRLVSTEYTFKKKIENCKFINDITSVAKIQFPRITREMKYNDDKIP